MKEHSINKNAWKDHIRLRPSMYVGDHRRISGFLQMLEYFMEENIAEDPSGTIIHFVFYPENKADVVINGIDASNFLRKLNALCTEDVMYALGTATLIALSEEIKIMVNDLPEILVLEGSKGNISLALPTEENLQDTISVSFQLDKEIFDQFRFEYETINEFLRQFAFLNPGLKIGCIDKTGNDFQQNVFHYPTGIFKQLDHFVAKQYYGNEAARVNIEVESDNYFYKIGLSFASLWIDPVFIKTFAGNCETFLGGSLKDGIEEGIILGIKEFARLKKKNIKIDKRLLRETVTIIAAVKGGQLQFQGATKRKLGMPAVRKTARQLVITALTNYFVTHPNEAERVLGYFEKENF